MTTIRDFMDVVAKKRDDIEDELQDLECVLFSLRELIGQVRSDLVVESSTTAIKPLTPKQLVARAERDRNRSQQIQGVQKKAQERISALRSKIGK